MEKHLLFAFLFNSRNKYLNVKYDFNITKVFEVRYGKRAKEDSNSERVTNQDVKFLLKNVYSTKENRIE